MGFWNQSARFQNEYPENRNKDEEKGEREREWNKQILAHILYAQFATVANIFPPQYSNPESTAGTTQERLRSPSPALLRPPPVTPTVVRYSLLLKYPKRGLEYYWVLLAMLCSGYFSAKKGTCIFSMVSRRVQEGKDKGAMLRESYLTEGCIWFFCRSFKIKENFNVFWVRNSMCIFFLLLF